MLEGLLAAALTFAALPVLAADGAAAPPAPPPMTADQMLRELRAHMNVVFTAMKKSPLENPEQCQKVMGSIRAYTKKSQRSFKRIRAFQHTMTRADAKRLEDLLSSVMTKYSEPYMKFSENCHKQLDEFEELMDGITSSSPGGGQTHDHDHDEDSDHQESEDHQDHDR